MSETERQIEEAKRLLAEAGFALTIGGCGCCGSPWVRLNHNGRDVIHDPRHADNGCARDDAGFTMHEQQERIT